METFSSDNSPLVSIVVTCFNQGHYLAEAIESIRDQTYGEIEMIIVDDGSTDDTAAVASKFGEAHLISQANAGLSAARNAGLHHARGKFITFLDADDLLLSQAIELGVACHMANPGCAFVYGGHRGISADGRVLWQQASPVHDDAYRSFLEGNPISMHGTVLYDRDTLRSEGGFDTSYDACEDYDAYLRLSRAHRVAFHHGVVADYRQHDGNMSRDCQRMLRTSTAVLHAQVKHANTNQSYQHAYRAGLRFFRSYYGQPLIGQAVRELCSAATRRPAMRRLNWAMRHSPSVFLMVGTTMLRRLLPGPLKQLLTSFTRKSPPFNRLLKKGLGGR